MSFVGGAYTHDVFVSYAHGKDLERAYSDPHSNPLSTWSKSFIDRLQEQIALNLSDSDRSTDVWMDPALRSTGSLEGNLAEDLNMG